MFKGWTEMVEAIYSRRGTCSGEAGWTTSPHFPTAVILAAYFDLLRSPKSRRGAVWQCSGAVV